MPSPEPSHSKIVVHVLVCITHPPCGSIVPLSTVSLPRSHRLLGIEKGFWHNGGLDQIRACRNSELVANVSVFDGHHGQGDVLFEAG